MIENFEAVKKQLSQLAGVINSFKSEAVQLKIIELIFGESGSFEEDTSDDEKPKGKRKVRRKTVTKKEQGGGRISTSKKKAMGGTGAVATVTQLATGEFFKQSRTINDIIEHCKHNLARTFKANEFSGKLSRMVRNKELIRKKNKDGQYEYRKS